MLNLPLRSWVTEKVLSEFPFPHPWNGEGKKALTGLAGEWSEKVPTECAAQCLRLSKHSIHIYCFKKQEGKSLEVTFGMSFLLPGVNTGCTPTSPPVPVLLICHVRSYNFRKCHLPQQAVNEPDLGTIWSPIHRNPWPGLVTTQLSKRNWDAKGSVNMPAHGFPKERSGFPLRSQLLPSYPWRREMNPPAYL